MRAATSMTICVCLLACAISSRAHAQGNGPRTPVTVQEVSQVVASELQTRLPKEPPSPVWDMDIPVAVPAAGTHKLRVASVCRDTESAALRFQIACAEPGACLPFLAYVRTPVAAAVPPCGGRAVSAAGSPARAPAVQPGNRATAMLAIAGLRMTATVTCLERGVPGDIILVRGQEGRVFRARVTGPRSVAAMLPGGGL